MLEWGALLLLWTLIWYAIFRCTLPPEERKDPRGTSDPPPYDADTYPPADNTRPIK